MAGTAWTEEPLAREPLRVRMGVAVTDEVWLRDPWTPRAARGDEAGDPRLDVTTEELAERRAGRGTEVEERRVDATPRAPA